MIGIASRDSGPSVRSFSRIRLGQAGEERGREERESREGRREGGRG